MSRNFSLRLLRLVLPAAFLALFAQAGMAQPALSPLHYFKNYFVTGDFTVAGVGLRGTGLNGFATGQIHMSSVPCTIGSEIRNGDACNDPLAVPADVVSAFLYWQTEETSPVPVGMNGFFKAGGATEFQPIVGKQLGDPQLQTAACWSSGGTSGASTAWGRAYRADVLRHLQIDTEHNVRRANGMHAVRLPDSGGNGNGNIIFTNGSTLVVVYRIVVPGQPLLVPHLRSVVAYEGVATLTKGSSMSQDIGGFYQALGDAPAKVVPIVGNGQAGFNSTVTANGTTIATNAFRGAAGSRWDNPELTIDLARDAASYSLGVTAGNNQVCLTVMSVWTSTNVVDGDGDGLLDKWETAGVHLNPGTLTQQASFGGCPRFDATVPQAETCADFPAMGSVHGRKDIFVEIDWLRGDDGHVHFPKLEALAMVANAFERRGINLHFDVGSDSYYQKDPELSYIVPAAYAEGGQVIEESSLVCPNALITECTFPGVAVQSWKRGVRAVKDGFPLLGIRPHFLQNRKDTVHYALFGHALGITAGPSSNTLKAVSGAGDRPGGDLVVTFGLWRSDIPGDDQTGSATVQAGTLMHELGHNLNLRHAAFYDVPNCQPNYPSVMNYQYQTRGLTDIDGLIQVDYADGTVPGLSESTLLETLPSALTMYRLRYYAPATALDIHLGAQAKAHCDGSSLNSTGPQEFMVRMESTSPAQIDWNNDGAIAPAGSTVAPVDVNFNGFTADPVQDSVDPDQPSTDIGKRWFVDSNDWEQLDFRQVGARLNVNGLSVDIGALDLGALDLGALDLGALDLGALDLGALDLGALDLGALDLGALDLGALDLGGELDFDTVIRSTPDAPRSLTATSGTTSITLNWSHSGLGQVAQYDIYRTTGTSFPSNPGLLASVAGSPPPTTYEDQNIQFNTSYTYFVSAVLNAFGSDGSQLKSGPSNFATGYVAKLPAYAFTGFLPPLSPDGAFAGTFNRGQGIPVKYQLKDATGAFVGDLSSLTSMTVGFNSKPNNGACPVASTFERVFTLYSPTAGATGGSTFRYESTSNQFIFNWDTSSGFGAGCYTLLLQLNDGSEPKTNRLRLK